MCGRFTVTDEIYEIRIAVSAQFEQLFRPWRPTFNVAPSAAPGHEQLIAITAADGSRVLKLARWWFIPSTWNKPLNQLPTLFNARAEDLGNRPTWRHAFASSRCLVPANGWREFKGPRGNKQPYHFHLDQKLFAFAGLWSTWRTGSGESVDSFAIITTQANSDVQPIHDRMPLIVPAECYSDWLNVGVAPAPVLQQAQRYCQQLSLGLFPSDSVANDVHYEGPRTIQRVTPQPKRPQPVQQSLFGDLSNFGVSEVARKR
jgi:putative SOS response-associated peptidase YedK